MNARMLLEQFDDAGKCALDGRVVRAQHCGGDRVDRRDEVAVDAVRECTQQRLVIELVSRCNAGHAGLLAFAGCAAFRPDPTYW